ncbi:MAG: phosphoribosylformylglycinamidine cyclo-ligase [Candidatus Zixiibacteriota bacterium]
MKNKNKIDYASAGVNLHAADEALDKIKKLARATFNENVLSDIGSFGGLFKPPLEKFKEPILVSSTDSVGTKLKLAFMTGIHNTVGQCIVNHGVNDILVQGATPLFFMDYLGVGVVKPEIIAQIVEGLTVACMENNMPLLGGETAELPGFYKPGEYDLVGTIVGMVDRNKIVDGSAITEGNIIYGLPSVGLHTNGYSLARKICFEIAGLQADSYVEEIKGKIGLELLKVHRSYLKSITQLMNEVNIKGMAHITGGGIAGNLIRIIPKNLKAVLKKDSWPNLPIFEYLQRQGGVADNDMFDAFNMGIGYIVVVDKSDITKTEEVLANLNQEFYRIGAIEKGVREVGIK